MSAVTAIACFETIEAAQVGVPNACLQPESASDDDLLVRAGRCADAFWSRHAHQYREEGVVSDLLAMFIRRKAALCLCVL